MIDSIDIIHHRTIEEPCYFFNEALSIFKTKAFSFDYLHTYVSSGLFTYTDKSVGFNNGHRTSWEQIVTDGIRAS